MVTAAMVTAASLEEATLPTRTTLRKQVGRLDFVCLIKILMRWPWILASGFCLASILTNSRLLPTRHAVFVSALRAWDARGHVTGGCATGRGCCGPPGQRPGRPLDRSNERHLELAVFRAEGPTQPLPGPEGPVSAAPQKTTKKPKKTRRAARPGKHGKLGNVAKAGPSRSTQSSHSTLRNWPGLPFINSRQDPVVHKLSTPGRPFLDERGRAVNVNLV